MTQQLEREFLSLLDTHRGILRKVAQIYGKNYDDAQDLESEISLQAWKSYPNFKGKAKFSTWLYRLALNVALTHQKVESKHPNKEADFNESLSVNPSGDRSGIVRHIRALKDLDKLLIMLHLDGYPNEEIGELSGLSTNHVAVKLHRIKSELSKKIKHES